MNALKESQDSPEDNAKEPQHDRATTLLRWLELQGLILDHARLRKTHPSDAWWVVMPEAEEVTGPYEFRGVLAALVEGAGPIQIVHDSQAALEDAPWTTLHYRPLWLNPQVLGFWRGALWALAALFAYILVTSAIPPAGHWLVNIAFVLSAGGLLARRFLVPFWSKVQPLLATKAASKRRLKKAVAVTLVTAVVAWMAWLPKEDYESLLTRGQAAWAQIASWFPGKGKAPKPTVKAAPPAAAVNEAPQCRRSRPQPSRPNPPRRSRKR